MFIIDFLMREPVLGISYFLMGFGFGCAVMGVYGYFRLNADIDDIHREYR